VIDFYSAEVKLAIEVDGESHFMQGAQQRDAVRQAFIESFAIKTIRFQNPEIHDNIDGVLEIIAKEIELRRAGSA
jgi:very-short-patch-repair endonuclease